MYWKVKGRWVKLLLAPTSRGAKEDTLACDAMGIDMRKRMKILRQKWQSQGVRTPLEIRMGISTGYCTVGNFGSEDYRQ